MGLFQARMGEKEKPWIRVGQGGSTSGRFSSAQKLMRDYRNGDADKDICSGHTFSGCF